MLQRRFNHRVGVSLLLASMLSSWSLPAQTVTASVSGAVVDPSRAPVPNVEIRIVSDATGASRRSATDGFGNFSFNALPPAVYTLTITHEGFHPLTKKNIVLQPSDRLSVGTLVLELGSLSDSVTVTSEGTPVQVNSTERSGVISSKQIENLTIVNRDFSTLVSLMPGVVTDVGGEAQGFGQNATFYVQGNRRAANNITIDGVPADSSNAYAVSTYISMDAVDNVKVLVSNFQAEFGRKPGAGIQAITKSGSKQFHGAAYWYQRNEALNATDFFNNRNGVSQPPYRYTTAGFNIGGPVVLPRFNHDRNKLFFFASSEQIREARPQAIRQLTMPTALERGGDFSQSRNTNGALIVVKDPLTKAPFAGNIVPLARINTAGQSLLKLFPTPNVVNSPIAGFRYNYQVQESVQVPKSAEILRLDHIVNERTNISGRFNYWWEDQRGWSVTAGNGNWGWLPSHYQDVSLSSAVSITHTFSPSSVFEGSMGFTRWSENDNALNSADLIRLNRKQSGVDIGQFHPELNPLDLVPNVSSWGGVNAAPTTKIEGRFPLTGLENTLTWNAALTHTQGSHTAKFGFYAERWLELKGRNGNFNGTFDFGTSSNNPNDSGYAFANAMLGNFYSYTESSSRVALHGRTTTLEWYAQDNWRVNRHLTFDLGVRFGWGQPFHSNGTDEAGFVPSLWNPAQKVTLIQPTIQNGVRVGVNPITGQIYNQVAIGSIVPGAGETFNGTVDRAENPSYPQGFRSNSGLKAAPRFGLSYDPFGKGKTAIRSGFGIYYDLHERDNFVNGLYYNPPLQLNPTMYFGNLSTFVSQPSLTFPSSTSGFDGPWRVARVMSSYFGIQQDIGFNTVVEVAYSGSLGRHLQEQHNINSTPLGTNFLPSSIDPTRGTPLSVDFLRPYTGYGNIILHSYDANSSYHSLQVSANRRYSHGFQLGAAWTWSKAMDYVDDDQSTISYQMPKNWNYGKASFDRTHVVKISWTWELPPASKLLNKPVVRVALDNWQLSSIETFQSGAPTGISLGYASGYSPDITGSTESARVNVIAPPEISRDQRTFEHYFNTAAFAPPSARTYGSATKDEIRGPGLENWDVSLFKNFKLTERFRAQFRCETYNTFNHTQFTGLDTTTRFDAKGVQTNPTFGQLTSARPARRLQLALRVTF